MGGKPGSTEVGLEVEDVDATWQMWQKAGVELLGRPEDQPFGRTFNAIDPDGHILAVYKLAGN